MQSGSSEASSIPPKNNCQIKLGFFWGGGGGATFWIIVGTFRDTLYHPKTKSRRHAVKYRQRVGKRREGRGGGKNKSSVWRVLLNARQKKFFLFLPLSSLFLPSFLPSLLPSLFPLPPRKCSGFLCQGRCQSTQGREREERGVCTIGYRRRWSPFPFPLQAQMESKSISPTTNCGMQKKWKLRRNTYTLHARFRTVGADFVMLSRCLLAKISASELSPKFIKSALLVGREWRYGRCWKDALPIPPPPKKKSWSDLKFFLTFF